MIVPEVSIEVCSGEGWSSLRRRVYTRLPAPCI